MGLGEGKALDGDPGFQMFGTCVLEVDEWVGGFGVMGDG